MAVPPARRRLPWRGAALSRAGESGFLRPEGRQAMTRRAAASARQPRGRAFRRSQPSTGASPRKARSTCPGTLPSCA
jgi:hypothetical protein